MVDNNVKLETSTLEFIDEINPDAANKIQKNRSINKNYKSISGPVSITFGFSKRLSAKRFRPTQPASFTSNSN